MSQCLQPWHTVHTLEATVICGQFVWLKSTRKRSEWQWLPTSRLAIRIAAAMLSPKFFPCSLASWYAVKTHTYNNKEWIEESQNKWTFKCATSMLARYKEVLNPCGVYVVQPVQHTTTQVSHTGNCPAQAGPVRKTSNHCSPLHHVH